ncbi:MAG: hypothetical protein Q4G24_06125 [Paracoccus sp. (in: a-proteobacteria)]|uniref:hypothetical protein n=1 Tax=Paracoccus sp. TaxID=267 RepID=UPI0026DFA6D1|nr:hypothetical protein [Paracoccus sp. (in: a-proteobacteria)]MDO5621031.1 hypothetical protein [Paracoccus sp. (in: a-proteobacteria)]
MRLVNVRLYLIGGLGLALFLVGLVAALLQTGRWLASLSQVLTGGAGVEYCMTNVGYMVLAWLFVGLVLWFNSVLTDLLLSRLRLN